MRLALVHRLGRVLASAATAVACAGGRAAPPPLNMAANSQLDAALSHARATPPDTDGDANHVLGVVRAARMSPDGRLIAVLDDVAPTVKLLEGRHVVFALHTPGDTTDEYELPVIALSNRQLLVLDADPSANALYEWRTHTHTTIPAPDFVPMSATALSDSAWVAYGPSPQQPGGRVRWIHCLLRDPARGWIWRAALADSVATAADSLGDPLISVMGGHAMLDHVRGHASATVVVTCPAAGDRSDPQAARAVGAPDTPFDVARYPHVFAMANGRPVSMGDEILTRRERPWGARTQRLVTSIRLRDDHGSPPVRVSGDFQVMDSRSDLGVLIAVNRGRPALFILSPNAIGSLVDVGQAR
jgi:hypothetical protein